MLDQEALYQGTTALLSDGHDMPPPPLPPPGERSGGPRRQRRERQILTSPPLVPAASVPGVGVGELPHRPADVEAPPSPARVSAFRSLKDSAGGDSSMSVRQAEARWLGFLFLESMALVVFQVLAFLQSHSLALGADLGHSGADVISYGINYFMELRKVNMAARAHGRGGRLSAAVSISERNADIIGCGVSTVLLVFATGDAVREAVQRLMYPAKPDDLDEVGPFMLAFSVITTAANVGTLIVYKVWCSPGDAKASLIEPYGETPGRIELTSYKAPSPDDIIASPPRKTSAPDGVPEQVASATRPVRKGNKGGLNLVGSYSNVGEDGTCARADCQDECCTSAPGPSWRSVLHMLVHPGCDGNHGGKQATPGKAASNLNVVAAMLHLVADVLRGIAILVVASLIEVGILRDQGRADAICALAVAVFVAIGSLTLLLRLVSALKRCIMTRHEYDMPSV